MEYLGFIIALWGIYGMQILLLHLVVGEMGLLALCQGVFFGCGAYGVAIAANSGLGLLPAIGVALLVAVFVAMVLGISLYRLAGDEYALATFAAALVFHDVVLHWVSVTGGAMGITMPVLFPDYDMSHVLLIQLLVIGTLVLLALEVTRRWRAAPLGRTINTMREDEILAAGMAKSVERNRIIAFGISAVGGAVGGACYAFVVGVVDPGAFDPMVSVLFVAMIIIGGTGSTLGPILGAGLIVGLPELLRFADLSGSSAAHIKQLVFGVLLYVIVAFRPQGLLGRLSIGVERRV
uniref:Branched-chain amino acid transport system permease protein n=1 Tax=Candidatus Kentrum sp. TC TaxID=2126339 RepID=A0A450YVR1_9GAMM|nr:MAG: branched-chain amino acid transport system permease protein [Candidatus Kentron sp. TC]